ncbi:serine/threonine-protein kinase [Streptomyces fildesensis]|uniref:non-specific serine/threonine protein kinase n=1 Tax=Streptomyces fildesensis TaxID=375757 RepID=A0ABW8C2W6_9ACTN
MTTGDTSGGELVGTVIAGRYRVTAQLGRGGMGVVCRAVDEVLGREVAVKVLRAYNDASGPELADLRARMQREARAAARIRHSGVITVHDVTEQQGLPVIVMELVEGPSLDDVLSENGAMDPREAAAIGAKVMDALDAAHRAGVLHRDVKPGNVLLDRSGRVVLTDFGIASVEAPDEGAMTKLTQDGVIVGSLDFLAPERAKGQEPGPASDIWALGMTLYAAVEGGSAFRRTSVWSTLNAIVGDPLPEPRQSGPLAPVLLALMAKEPADRPSADQARRMLETVAAGSGTKVPPASVAGAAPLRRPVPPAGAGAANASAGRPLTPASSPAEAAPPPGAAGYRPSAGLGGSGGPLVSPAGGRERRTEPLPSRRRNRGRITVAAAAAAVVLAGGGLAYALVGTGDSGGGGPKNHAAGSSRTPQGEANIAGEKADGKAGKKGGSKSSGASATSSHTSGKPTKQSGGASPSDAGSPSASGSKAGGAPSSPAAPSTSASAVSKSCTGWTHQDPHPGTYGYMTGSFHLTTGPYAACPDVAMAKSGAKVFYHCFVLNAYGHTWTYVRIDGTKTAGWMSNDNLTKQKGPAYHC